MKRNYLISLFFIISFPVTAVAEEITSSANSLQEPPVSINDSKAEETINEEDQSETDKNDEEVQMTTDANQVFSQEFSEQPTPFIETVEPLISGAGAVENPYEVTTFTELKEALAITVDSGETKYIRLQNDIVYNGSVDIGYNTVIDGNGFAFLYSGTNYGTAHFKTGANDIAITYKNLSFGNSLYPNSTYYGLLYNDKANVHFTVENINYNIQNGGQPFWGNNNAGNILELKGQNVFNSSGKSYGGEFIEGYRNVIFSEDSNTTIYNDTPDATALFWSTAQTVTIAQRAVLTIESSKPLLFYGDNPTLNIEEQGELHFKKFYGTNYQTNDVSLSSIGTLTGNMAKDSIAHFTTETNSFSGNSPIFNFSSPDYLVFDTNSSSKQVFSSGFNPKFNRKDADAYTYRIDYLTAGGQVNYNPDVQVNNSYTITSASIGNGYSVVYSRTPKIESMSATPEVATDISDIHAQIETITPTKLVGHRIQYKLAAKQLYTGVDITDQTAQDSIEQAVDTESLIKSMEVLLAENSPLTGITTKATFQQLAAANYHLYAKVEGSRIANYVFQSPWQEIVAEVPAFTLMQFSNNTMAFNSPIPGQFGQQQNLDQYTVRNAGNVPATVNLKSIVCNSENTPTLSLVDQFISNKQEFTLSLVAEKVDSKEKVIMGPLTETASVNQPGIPLKPFWEPDNQAVLYFTGNYSGPMEGPQHINYRFSFAISSENMN